MPKEKDIFSWTIFWFNFCLEFELNVYHLLNQFSNLIICFTKWYFSLVLSLSAKAEISFRRPYRLIFFSSIYTLKQFQYTEFLKLQKFIWKVCVYTKQCWRFQITTIVAIWPQRNIWKRLMLPLLKMFNFRKTDIQMAGYKINPPICILCRLVCMI